MSPLKTFNINTESCESLASDRPSWRQLILKRARAAEKPRSLHTEQKRAARKARATITNSTVPTHFWPTCGRGFLVGVALSATSEHTVGQPTRCHGHFRLQRTNNKHHLTSFRRKVPPLSCFG